MKPQLTIDQSGTKFWHLNGIRHRTDGPAIIYPDGSKYWYRKGEFHRTDGPAVIYYDGPAIIYPNGTKYWYVNGNYYPQKIWFNTLIKMYLK